MNRRDLSRRVDALESTTSLHPDSAPDLTDDQARMTRKWNLGIDGDLSPSERRTLETVLDP